MIFGLIAALVGVAGGTMAALVGAGVGSTLVPLFAVQIDFKLAVAAAAIPHLVGGIQRTVQLRHHVDGRLLLRFGIVCALTSLIGALLHAAASHALVTYLFAGLLVLAGLLGLGGLSERLKFRGPFAWIAGAISGFFGGFAGEQGGIRAVALLGFDLGKEAFVATGTAVGVLIDVVRTPVYVATYRDALAGVWGIIILSTLGVVVGTAFGGRLLRKVPGHLFKRVVSAIILGIGALLFLHAPQ